MMGIGYHTVTPYLVVNDGDQAVEFYRRAFGAVELYRVPSPSGGVGHAEIQLGDSRIMIGEESPAIGTRSPATIGGSPVALNVYVDDADELFARAVAAGATVRRPVTDQFFGDRAGAVADPFGHEWTIAARSTDVLPEAMVPGAS